MAHRLERLESCSAPAHQCRLQALVALVIEAEVLGDIVDDDGATPLDHSSSASRRSSRLNTAIPAIRVATATPVRAATSPSGGTRKLYKQSRYASTNPTIGLSS